MGVSVGNRRLVSEINVTPFVDVMLVLLIIFMVTAPMLTEGLEIQLPRTQQVQVLPTDSDHVVMTIKKDGTIFLNEIATNKETLAQQLVTTVKDTGAQLFLQADKDVPYGEVVDVMGRVRAAGIEDMGIVAERVDDSMPLDAAPEASPASPSGAASGTGQ